MQHVQTCLFSNKHFSLIMQKEESKMVNNGVKWRDQSKIRYKKINICNEEKLRYITKNTKNMINITTLEFKVLHIVGQLDKIKISGNRFAN